MDTEEYDFDRNYMGSLKWTHSISDKTFYEVTIGSKYNTFERKIKDWNDRDGDGDFDEFLKWANVRVPDNPGDRGTTWVEDLRFTTDDTKFFWVDANEAAGWEGGYKYGVPGVSDFKEVWVLNKTNYEYSKQWRFVTGTHNEKELTTYPIAEELESTLYPTVPDGYFDYYGDGFNYFDMKNDVIDVKADFTSQVTPQHLVKAGVSFDQTNMKMLNVGFYSVSNLYIDEYDVKPWNIAAYVQDKMEFQGMIVNLGLRMDYYNHGKDVYYPANFQDPVDISKEPGDPGYIKNPTKADPFLYISPRLGVSHPITENSVIHFSYGHFYQRPEYRFWFENMGYNFQGSYSEMGNPTLKPEHTVAYEIGLQQNMGDYLLGLNAFYKDIANLTDQVEAGEAPFSDYWLYENRDWANVRGFEVTLRKFFSHYFAGNIAYTYMIANGKASSPQSGGSELWRKLTGVQKAYALNWDRRHSFNANVTFSVPKWNNQWDGWLLGDWALSVLFTYGSPKPYTPPTRDPQPEYNTERLVEEVRFDLKLEKRFAISGTMRALLFIEGYNLLNRQNLVNFDGDLTNLDDITWLQETGTYEGRNLDPFAWGPRRNFRFGLGFEF
jgi:outer membrane receptor protein involved in Fe transport